MSDSRFVPLYQVCRKNGIPVGSGKHFAGRAGLTVKRMTVIVSRVVEVPAIRREDVPALARAYRDRKRKRRGSVAP